MGITALVGSGLIQTAVVYLISDKAGGFVSNILSRKGLLGMGTKAGKRVAQRRVDRRHAEARSQRVKWLESELAREIEDLKEHS